MKFTNLENLNFTKTNFMKLLLATQNPKKIEEIKAIIPNEITITSLIEYNLEELPEDQNTLEGNALQKARFVNELTEKNCLADDTGLEISALNGEPGVYSARYAGELKNADDNMNKVLSKLDGIDNRKAQFRTVLALIWEGQEYLFEGKVEGNITESKAGNLGFGYDPIFIPEENTKTYAEMSLNEKSQTSHRSRALKELVSFLTNEIA